MQLELLPDEELRVVDMKVVPNDDYASVFDGANAGTHCVTLLNTRKAACRWLVSSSSSSSK